MKKSWFIILILLVFGTIFPAHAAVQFKKAPEFYLYNSQPNKDLKVGTALVTLRFRIPNFRNIPPGFETVVYYSVNDKTDTLFLDSSMTQTLEIKSGKTRFKFWGGPGYSEIISDSIDIQSQTTQDAYVRFSLNYIQVEVDKPVIYFQSPQLLDFSLQVIPNGTFSFTYPPYSNEWKGKVHPNGQIEISGKRYPYLFWDSKQQFQLQKTASGYQVAKTEVLSFLEKQLSDLGLSSNEKADFITYWGPKMIQYESVFVQFYLQESCDQFATLHCDPQPEQINRIYLAFSEWDESFRSYLNPVVQTPFVRTGFNLLEWGGFEIKFPDL